MSENNSLNKRDTFNKEMFIFVCTYACICFIDKILKDKDIRDKLFNTTKSS